MKQVVIAGRAFSITADGLTELCRDVYPEPVRDHFVVIGGRRFPPKQVIALATGIDRNDFTTNQARAVMRRLGFAVGRARDAKNARAAETAAPYRSSSADALRPYLGKWVGLRGEDVIAAGDAPGDVLAQLRGAGLKAESMFRVPLDPASDIGGFAS